MFKHLKFVILLFSLLTLVSLPLDRVMKNNAREHYLIHEDPSDTTIYQGGREEISAHAIGDAWYILQLTYVRNHGASWGVLKDLGEDRRLPALVICGALMIGLLLYVASWLYKSSAKFSAVFIITITSGAVGNLWDRLFDGYVTDMFALKWSFGSKVFALPAFNVADVMIVTGLFGFIISMIFTKSQK